MSDTNQVDAEVNEGLILNQRKNNSSHHQTLVCFLPDSVAQRSESTTALLEFAVGDIGVNEDAVSSPKNVEKVAIAQNESFSEPPQI